MSKKANIAACIALFLITSAVTSWAEYTFYVKIEGTKQGVFKGESTRAAWQTQIPCYQFQHDVTSPRDVATGLPSGKRQHGPIKILKKLGAASPQLYQALCTNELLKTVLISFIGTSADGTEEVIYTIKLTNATISTISQETILPEATATKPKKTDASSDVCEYQWVSIAYQKIEWESKIGRTAAVDDWAR
jgi:type VI secretion system secreted protein Hcp